MAKRGFFTKLATLFASGLLLGTTACSVLDSVNPWAKSEPESRAPVKTAEKAAAQPAPEEEISQGGSSQQTEAAPGSSVTMRTEVPAVGTPTAPPNLSAVDVIWQVPDEPVKGYHISYGFDPNNLTQHIYAKVDELLKFDHPKFGPVFRYIIRGLPADKTVYVSLRAENKSGISDPTPPMKLEPGRRKAAE